MKCPMCPGHLQRIVYEGVELDRCRLCFGLWFDKGELERFSQDDPAFALSSGRTPADRHTTLRCPKCGGFLTEGSYAPGVFFRVERCDRCHGVWLDAERVAHVRGLAEAEVRPQHPAGPVDSKTVDPATSQEIEIERQEASKQVSVGEWLFLFLKAFAAKTHSTVPTPATSSAIAGILGAYIFLFPHRKIYFMIIVWPLRLAAVWYLGGWIAWQILAAAASTAGTGGVAWLAHVGGFFTGLALVVSYQALKRPDVALRFA